MLLGLMGPLALCRRFLCCLLCGSAGEKITRGHGSSTRLHSELQRHVSVLTGVFVLGFNLLHGALHTLCTIPQATNL
ncbi:hypothetical protein D3C85_1516810 [compost metagenome]